MTLNPAKELTRVRRANEHDCMQTACKIAASDRYSDRMIGRRFATAGMSKKVTSKEVVGANLNAPRALRIRFDPPGSLPPECGPRVGVTPSICRRPVVSPRLAPPSLSAHDAAASANRAPFLAGFGAGPTAEKRNSPPYIHIRCMITAGNSPLSARRVSVATRPRPLPQCRKASAKRASALFLRDFATLPSCYSFFHSRSFPRNKHRRAIRPEEARRLRLRQALAEPCCPRARSNGPSEPCERQGAC